MPMQSLPPMIIIAAAFTVIPLGMKATDWAFGKVRHITFVLTSHWKVTTQESCFWIHWITHGRKLEKNISILLTFSVIFLTLSVPVLYTRKPATTSLYVYIDSKT